MSSSGSTAQQPVQTTNQQKEPWSVAAPFLSSMYGSAESMRNSNTGYQPYAGQTLASPNNPQIDAGMGALIGGSMGELGGSSGVQAARNAGQQIIGSQGIGDGQAGVLSGLGNLATTGYDLPMGVYTNAASQANNAQNPYLQQLMDTVNRRVGDRVNSSFSGSGRYGSGQHTDILSRSLAEAEAPLMAQDYEARAARAMQAAQGAQGIAGARAGILGGMSDIYGQGLNRTGQWAQLMPALDEAAYAPARRLMDLGEYSRSREQQALDDATKKYNVQQAYPWEQLFRESAVLGGAGGLGGSTVTSVSQPKPSTLQSALGGGLAGAGLGSAFGPWGAGIGAAGGGLLGLMQ